MKELATGQEHMIGGDEFLQSSGAKWTPDGKKLLLIGGVGAPAMAALNRTVTQLYAVALAARRERSRRPRYQYRRAGDGRPPTIRRRDAVDAAPVARPRRRP